MIINDEDREKIEKLINILNRGWYCNGKEVTELYNRYVSPQKPVSSTSCSSCIRQRILKLKAFLAETIKREEEKAKENKDGNSKKDKG